MTNENPFGETIYSYSRAQAIEDGVLVDLSQVDSIRQAWKHPFARTSAVWAIIEEALKQSGQDIGGICHDISGILSEARDNMNYAKRRIMLIMGAGPQQLRAATPHHHDHVLGIIHVHDRQSNFRKRCAVF